MLIQTRKGWKGLCWLGQPPLPLCIYVTAPPSDVNWEPILTKIKIKLWSSINIAQNTIKCSQFSPAFLVLLYHDHFGQNYEDILQDSCIYGSMIPSFKTHGLHQGGGPWKGNGLELFVQQLLLALTLISAQKCFSSRRQVRTNCINLASRNETTRCQLSCFYLLTLPHTELTKFLPNKQISRKPLPAPAWTGRFLRKCWVFPALQHTHTVPPFGNIYHFRQLVLQLQRHRLLPR